MEPTDAISSWEQFCDGIRQAGSDILASTGDLDEMAVAEGLRYLTRLLRSGIERHVEYWDPLDPFMADTYNERLKWGLDNPDSIYLMSAVDGRYEYELTGNVGTVPYFNLTSAATGTDARHVQTGFLNGSDIRTDGDGNFIVRIGGKARDSNWLQLAPDSNSVMLRETFGVRSKEHAVTCRIRLLTDVGPDRPLALAQIQSRLQGALGFVGKTGKTFVHLAGLLAAGVNRLPAVDETLMRSMGGDPNYFYYWSAFRLEPGEVLLLQLPEVPECENWGLCLYDRWLASLDYSRATININKFTSTMNDDGSLTIVVAPERPEGGNWLSTCGHAHGNMMFRWTGAAKNVAPLTRIARADAIDWKDALRRWDL